MHYDLVPEDLTGMILATRFAGEYLNSCSKQTSVSHQS